MQARRTTRKAINLPGRYYTGVGAPIDITLSDVSTGGCRFPAEAGKLKPGSPIQIYVGGSGPHRASVRWLENGEIGVSFMMPLEQDFIDKIQCGHIPDITPESKPGGFKPMGDALPLRFC